MSTVEHSWPKLRLIKHYLQKTSEQQCLTALLRIETQGVDKMEIEKHPWF